MTTPVGCWERSVVLVVVNTGGAACAVSWSVLNQSDSSKVKSNDWIGWWDLGVTLIGSGASFGDIPISTGTPARTLFISGLKSRVMKLPFLSLKMMVKSGLEFILKLTEPLQSCCCPVQKYLPRLAELAWQLSRYLWRGSVNFKINSRPLFTIIFKLKNDNFMTRDFSPLIEWVLTGVNMC